MTLSCDMPIRPLGWAVMATHKNTGDSQDFACPKCKVVVPAMWVYKNDRDSLTKKQAEQLMISWMPKEKKPRGRNKKTEEEELPEAEAEPSADPAERRSAS